MSVHFIPDELVDTGQRFVLETTGYPREDLPIEKWQQVAYSDDGKFLHIRMVKLSHHPDVIHARCRARFSEGNAKLSSR